MAYEKPQTLLECAAHAVGIIITKPALDIFYKYMETEHINAEERRDLELLITRTAEFYDKLIPKPLHDIVTQWSLNSLPDDFECKLRNVKNDLNFLDIVLRSHTRRFNTTKWFHVTYNILYRSLQRLKSLQYLKLEEYKLKENLNHITEAIKNMKKLDSFKCFDFLDEIVEVLCANCPLKKLDIRYSHHVTDSSLPHILSLQSLEELKIFRCGISKNSCFQILNGLPHLITISCTHINSFLAHINDDSVQMPYQCVEYLCHAPEDLVNLTKYCPLIRKLELHISMNMNKYFRVSSVNGLPLCDLSVLAALSNLKSLKVYFGVLEYNMIKSFLQSAGHQLTELRIWCLIDKSAEIKNEIKSLCANLKSLHVA